MNGRHLTEAVDALGCAWYYNWGSLPNPENQVIHAEFIPMIWSRRDLESNLKVAKATGSKYLLGFNEPDGKDQANLTVQEAVDLWPQLMATGMALGSPATTTGAKWLDEFMTLAQQRHLRVDFICLHWYGDITRPNAVESLHRYVSKYWEKYQRPIWLTEFSGGDFNFCKRKTTVQDNAEFAAAAGAMLESLPYVQRFAWYGAKWTPHSNNYPTVGLYDSATHSLTPIGVAYKTLKNAE